MKFFVRAVLLMVFVVGPIAIVVNRSPESTESPGLKVAPTVTNPSPVAPAWATLAGTSERESTPDYREEIPTH